MDTKKITAKVEKLLKVLDDQLGYGYGRWQDEKEYEDINEYAILYAGKAKQLGWEITKMTARPYGFHAVHSKEKLELEVSIGGDGDLSWRARPMRLASESPILRPTARRALRGDLQ